MRRRSRKHRQRVGLRHIGQLLPELMVELEEADAQDSGSAERKEQPNRSVGVLPSASPQATFGFYSAVDS